LEKRKGTDDRWTVIWGRAGLDSGPFGVDCGCRVLDILELNCKWGGVTGHAYDVPHHLPATCLAGVDGVDAD